MRRLLALAAALPLLLLAAPAQAAAVESPGCAFYDGWMSNDSRSSTSGNSGAFGTNAQFLAGDRLTLTSTGTGTATVELAVANAYAKDSGPIGATLTYTFPADEVTTAGYLWSWTTAADLHVTLACESVQAAPTVQVLAPGPAPVIQAYGLVDDPTCQMTPDYARYVGVPDGGWSKSWQRWAVDKDGGPVCTRTLTYVNNQWVVG